MAKNQHLLIKSDVCKDEQLITLVQQSPVLYTQSHPKYTDTKHKQKIWDTIGALMEEDSLACKARWYNIRDNYRKTVRNSYTRSGGKRMKVYKYAPLLTFLHEVDEQSKTNFDDQEQTRSTLPSPTPPVVDDPTEEEPMLNDTPASDTERPEFMECIVMKDEVNETECRKVSAEGIAPKSPFDGVRESAVLRPTSDADHLQIKRPVLKRLATSITAPTSTILASKVERSDRMLEMLVNRAVQGDKSDPVDAFLAGIAPILKSLHPYYLNRARSEIFASVQKYELEMLIEPSPDPKRQK